MSKPAILGGEPVRASLGAHMAWPVGGAPERKAVLRVLHSGAWGAEGAEGERFRTDFARYCGARHALLTCNGTASIESILRALEIGRGDEVIVPPYTFVATVSAVCAVGAMPVFADIQADTCTLSAACAERAITPRTRAIIPVHLGGRPADMDALGALAQKHSLALIEDASHAHGSEWRDARAGSLGDAAAFSFQASKNIGCGEGGAITTNDEALYEKLRSVCNTGRVFASAPMRCARVGTDARLADWQAATLSARLLRLDGDIRARTEAASQLDGGFRAFPFLESMRADARITRNSLHLYMFRYHAEALGGLSRGDFIRALAAENVCQPSEGYCEPIYNMAFLKTEAFARATGRAFAQTGAEMPENEKIASREGCWLYHSALLGGAEEIDAILEAIERIARYAQQIKQGGARNG